jgi:hypothetical protein
MLTAALSSALVQGHLHLALQPLTHVDSTRAQAYARRVTIVGDGAFKVPDLFDWLNSNAPTQSECESYLSSMYHLGRPRLKSDCRSQGEQARATTTGGAHGVLQENPRPLGHPHSVPVCLHLHRAQDRLQDWTQLRHRTPQDGRDRVQSERPSLRLRPTTACRRHVSHQARHSPNLPQGRDVSPTHQRECSSTCIGK